MCHVLCGLQEAKEAEELLAQIREQRGNSSLTTMRQHRQQEFGSFLDSLADKYTSGKEGKAKKKKAKTQV